MPAADEIRFALRALRRAPTFTIVSIASLAVGIGANVTVFSLANTLLMRPLPVPAADRLARIGRTTRDVRFGAVSYPEYRDLAAAVAPAADLVGNYPNSAILTAPDGPKPAWLELVSDNYFTALGVRTPLGRPFSASDGGGATAAPVIVISSRLWRDRLAGDSGVIGRGVRLNGHLFTIVAVAPPEFHGTFTGFSIDGWVPVANQRVVSPSSGSIEQRDDRFLMLIAVRRPRMRDDALRPMLNVVAQRLQASQANPREAVRLELAGAGGVHPFVAGVVRAFVGLLQGIVLLVLLISCVNLANVLLVRASARQRELSLRAALGASRWRLARLALLEAVLIALGGGIAGTVFAAVAARAIERLDLPVGLPLGLSMSLDATVLLVAIAVTTVTALVFGAGPAIAASRASALANLRVAGATTDRRRSRLRSTLVGVQVAVATLLLSGAGLAVRSLRASALLDPGFAPARVHVIAAAPDLLGYDEARGRALWEEIATRARRVPGVESASLALFVPLGSRGDQLTLAPADRRQPDRLFGYNFVQPGYFATLGVRILAGRDFSPNDGARAPDVVVVSQAMARRFFPGGNAVGQPVRVVDRGGRARTPTVVGVVADIKVRSLGEAPASVAYLPFGQWYRPDMVLHVRVAANADRVIPAVVEQIHGAEPDLALDVQSMTRATEFSMSPLRVASVVLGFCGLVGALLAALGVFGLVAYAVSLRTREIGIRVALGASRAALTRLVGLQAFRPVMIGGVVGLALSIALGGAIKGILVGVQPLDPISLAGAAVLLLAAAALALVAPLRRALSVDPVGVLRAE
jgi:predicted permease